MCYNIKMNVTIESSWKQVLADEFEQPYFAELTKFVEQSINKLRSTHHQKVFAAFDHCPFDQVKVVIIGQDPYHGQVRPMDYVFGG